MGITLEQWEEFDQEGFLSLGQVATNKQIADMQKCINDIMLGLASVNYDQIMMQLDRESDTGRPGPQTKGHKGPTLLYRKIQQLEFAPIFLNYMRQDVQLKAYDQQKMETCARQIHFFPS